MVILLGMKIIVQFSGGKDSLASLLWAINTYGKNNIIAVFCDTKWEHELTYQHIKEVIEKTGVEFVTLNGKYSFIELARKKLRFPSTKARFCTDFLKIRPFIDWLIEMNFDYTIIIQGIRANESKSRSKMTRECQYFKYYFTPYGKDKKGKDKYMNYRKKKIIELELLGKCDIERPFFDATANDVMTYIKDNGFKPNPLYYIGFNRVGCFPCIMCSKSEMDLLIKKQPEYLTRIEDAELELGATFFPPDYIPKHALMPFQTKKKGIMLLPSIQAVVRYLKRRNKKGEMFEKEYSNSCMSIYNICE